MSNWLDLSRNANLIKQTYLRGFLDVSGGDIINRNGNLIIAGDTYLNNRLIVNGDVSMNGQVSLPKGDVQQQIDTLTLKIENLIAENMSLQTKLTNYEFAADSSLNTLSGSLNSVYEYFFDGDLHTNISRK